MCHIFALKRITADKRDRICSYLPHIAHRNVIVSVWSRNIILSTRFGLTSFSGRRETSEMSYIFPCEGVSDGNRHWMGYNLCNV